MTLTPGAAGEATPQRHRLHRRLIAGVGPAITLAPMATYECPTCGMSVNATCGACDAPLVNDSIQRDDGSSVQISKCPNGHGKIKSPMCCGADMSCAIT